jgi:signal transduction histidine kinase
MTRVDPDLSVRGDPTRLHRVFLNLAKNAIEAINGGGTIEVVATVDPGDDGQWVTVKVSDDGSGIPADDIDKVFEPFYTTKARGTGLGLAVVAQIVEEHGGAVSVRSMPDVGTEFTVRLRRV